MSYLQPHSPAKALGFSLAALLPASNVITEIQLRRLEAQMSLLERAGVDCISMTLSGAPAASDRHLIDFLRQHSAIDLQLNIPMTDAAIKFACAMRPHSVCLSLSLPEPIADSENWHAKQMAVARAALGDLRGEVHEIVLASFTEQALIQLLADYAVDAVSLSTTTYAEAKNIADRASELALLRRIAQSVHSHGLAVHAGGCLDFANVGVIAAIGVVTRITMGRALVSEATLVGLEQAARRLKTIINPNTADWSPAAGSARMIDNA